jgi:hypothetical protein
MSSFITAALKGAVLDRLPEIVRAGGRPIAQEDAGLIYLPSEPAGPEVARFPNS